MPDIPLILYFTKRTHKSMSFINGNLRTGLRKSFVTTEGMAHSPRNNINSLPENGQWRKKYFGENLGKPSLKDEL